MSKFDLDAIKQWIEENITPLRVIPEKYMSFDLKEGDDSVELTNVIFGNLVLEEAAGRYFMCEACGDDSLFTYLDIIEHIRLMHTPSWEAFKIPEDKKSDDVKYRIIKFSEIVERKSLSPSDYIDDD